jgi:hypothetical protein
MYCALLCTANVGWTAGGCNAPAQCNPLPEVCATALFGFGSSYNLHGLLVAAAASVSVALIGFAFLIVRNVVGY